MSLIRKVGKADTVSKAPLTEHSREVLFKAREEIGKLIEINGELGERLDEVEDEVGEASGIHEEIDEELERLNREADALTELVGSLIDLSKALEAKVIEADNRAESLADSLLQAQQTAQSRRDKLEAVKETLGGRWPVVLKRTIDAALNTEDDHA